MKRAVLIGLMLFLLCPVSPRVGAFAQDGDAGAPPVCASCGQPIAKEYVTALGKCWHPEHFVCAGCGRSLVNVPFYEGNGRPYCDNCYAENFCPRCSVCGLPIRSGYIENDWGDTYCTHHEKEFQPCFSCGRLVCDALTGGGVVYEDGRVACNLCRENAIDQTSDGQAVLEGVRRTLALLGLDFGNERISLKLGGLSQLKDGRARDLSGNTRTCTWSRDGEPVKREVGEITILYGLPYEHFAAVAAHELGHAWLFLQEYPELPPSVEEGLCELLSYLWLQQMDTTAARHRMRAMEENDDPVYGDGFRAALESYRRLPLDDLLTYVRRHGRFPDPD